MYIGGLSLRMRNKFIKIANAPFNICIDPEFEERIEYFELESELSLFLDEIGYINENEYLDKYDLLIKTLVNEISNLKGYNKPFEISNNVSNFYKDKVKDMYHPELVGYKLIVFDIKQANFQSLKYSGVVFGVDKWKDFISKYTNYKHLINSKTFRQTVFGNLNPKVQRKIQKAMIHRLVTYLDLFALSKESIAFVSTDAVGYYTTKSVKDINESIENIFIEFPIDVSMSIIRLGIARLFQGGNKKSKQEFFIKQDLNNQEMEICCCSKMYRIVAEKLFRGEELSSIDRTFYYEGFFAEFRDDFTLEVIPDLGVPKKRLKSKPAKLAKPAKSIKELPF